MSGLAMLCLPRSRVHGASAVLRSGMLCGLVVAAPLVLRLPAEGARIVRESSWLDLAPPIWFLGVERWLLGERTPHLIRLAEWAALGVTSAGLLAAGSYAVLYARFDRIMLRPFRTSAPWRLSFRRPPWMRIGRPAVEFTAIAEFTTAALRRSALHQGIVLALSACGVALVVNSLIGAEVFGALHGPPEPPRIVLDEVTWAPCALIFIFTLAVRAAIVVPLEPRANWLFRMTEHDGSRPAQLDAVVHVMRWIGVGIPIALTLPIEWMVLGPRAIVGLAVAGFYGLVFVEVQVRDWRRIPFTCSYLPGKRAVTNSAILGFITFILFAGFGAGLIRAGVANPARGVAAIGLLGVLVVILRRNRMKKWQVMPLMFEDLMPTEIQPIGLPRE